MEGRKKVIITIMGGLEGCKGSWEALKNKLILTEFFIKLQVINKTVCCGYEKKIKPVKMLN